MATVKSLWLIRVLPFFIMMWTVNSQNGVSIRLMGQELTSGISQVCLSDIGEQPSRANISDGVPDTVEGTALVCVTNNPNCCRAVDNPNGGVVGDWTINYFVVPGINADPPTAIYRNRGTGLVRISYRPSAEGADPPLLLTGEYCCMIPDMSGVTQRLCVEVNNDTMCNSSASTTTVQPPPVTGELTTATETNSNIAPASANESPATFILAGIVVILSIIILLLISLVILLFYKYKRAKQSHDVMGTQDMVQAIATDIDLNDNQAYGKAREAQNKTMPQDGQTIELYDYIPNTLFQGHPPGAQTSAMDDSEGVVSSEVYQEIL